MDIKGIKHEGVMKVTEIGAVIPDLARLMYFPLLVEEMKIRGLTPTYYDEIDDIQIEDIIKTAKYLAKRFENAETNS